MYNATEMFLMDIYIYTYIYNIIKNYLYKQQNQNQQGKVHNLYK